MPDLILASASPRRRELLALTGLTFEIDAAEVDEHTNLGAKEAVQELCRRKALAVASRHPGEIILGFLHKPAKLLYNIVHAEIPRKPILTATAPEVVHISTTTRTRPSIGKGNTRPLGFVTSTNCGNQFFCSFLLTGNIKLM